jgi:hypothetical protein
LWCLILNYHLKYLLLINIMIGKKAL